MAGIKNNLFKRKADLKNYLYKREFPLNHIIQPLFAKNKNSWVLGVLYVKRKYFL